MALSKSIGAALLLAALIRPAQAENWAVLIGITEYPAELTLNSDRLEGPVHDVDALKTALVKWGFSDDGKHIVTLKDRNASRAAIIDALLALQNSAKPGDQVFIYYSGHGTSPNDVQFGGHMSLPFGSGALIPYDFPVKGSNDAKRAGLIIPREHLKASVLDKLNQDRAVFVVFDTCYSANTLRSTKQLTSRKAAINIPSAELNLGHNEGSQAPLMPEYPYQKNIVFLAASSDRESASDIGKQHLSEYPTLDGLPHGALTDALLRVLTGKLVVDTNQDKSVDYRELLKGLQEQLKQRGIRQTPTILPLAEEDRYPYLRSRALFGQPSPFAQASVAGASGNVAPTVTVRLMDSASDLADELNRLAKIKPVPTGGDFSIDRVNDRYRLLNKTDDVVADVPVADHSALFGRIMQESVVMRLEAMAAQKATFNLELSLDKAMLGITRVEGETFALVAHADEAAYWLLLDVKSNGEVEILYPRYPKELEIRPGKQAFFIPGDKEDDKLVVTKPFGLDHVVAFAFKEKPSWLNTALKPVYLPDGTEFSALVDQLLAVKVAYAFGKWDALTVAKPTQTP